MFSNKNKYQDYLNSGKAGDDFSDFVKRDPNSGRCNAADVMLLQNYASGLIQGGHLEKFRHLYGVLDEHQAQKIIEIGLEAAVNTKNLYLFEEIKGMAYRSIAQFAENSLRTRMNGWSESKDRLAKFDEHARQMNPPHDLIKSINDEIEKVKREGCYVEPWLPGNRWKDMTSRYPDKHRVLIEVKKYLLGASDIRQLSQVVADSPQYDKTLKKRSETGKLLDRALEAKGESLIKTPKIK